jgi:hypothetical protein
LEYLLIADRKYAHINVNSIKKANLLYNAYPVAQAAESAGYFEGNLRGGMERRELLSDQYRL